jgi:hypothetical protein
VELAVDRLEALAINMSVDLRRLDAGVPQPSWRFVVPVVGTALHFLIGIHR